MSDENVSLVFSDSELKLLREKNNKLTDLEFDVFLATARRYRLNPLANQIYARLQDKTEKNPRAVTYMTQIDGYRLIADRTGAYAGSDDAAFDNQAAKNPGRATVTVYKIVEGQRCAFTASARWEEYKPTNNSAAFMWNRMPFLMLGKCAEALALRKAFPNELSGLYTVEEMQQADDASDPPAAAAPPSTGNPYRDEQNRRAAKATPEEPPKRTSKEIIESKKTSSELTRWLIAIQEKMPIKENIDKWKTILDEADIYVGGTSWNDAQKKAVTTLLLAINNEIKANELDVEVKELVERDADVPVGSPVEEEVPA